MSKYNNKYFSIYTGGKIAILALFCLIHGPKPASAQERFDAGAVMRNMQGSQRFTFVAGVVEGLAIARYMRDRQQPAGMECIYDWFYKGGQGVVDTIYAAFERYPTYPPGVVIDVLTKQRCPG